VPIHIDNTAEATNILVTNDFTLARFAAMVSAVQGPRSCARGSHELRTDRLADRRAQDAIDFCLGRRIERPPADLVDRLQLAGMASSPKPRGDALVKHPADRQMDDPLAEALLREPIELRQQDIARSGAAGISDPCAGDRHPRICCQPASCRIGDRGKARHSRRSRCCACGNRAGTQRPNASATLRKSRASPVNALLGQGWTSEMSAFVTNATSEDVFVSGR
jgi:hypothetical protein